MFGKLLKYDFRSMLKQFAFIWPAALVLAVINRFTLNGLDSSSAVGETTAGITMLVYVAILVAMFAVTMIFVIQRFFKGLLGDEGYLMHTLPVRPWELIGSKLLCAVATTLLSIVVAICSILFIVPWDGVNWGEVFSGLRYVLSHWNSHATHAFFFLLEFLLFLCVGTAQSYLHLYLSMAIGHLFNKNRVAMSVVAYIAINAIISALLSFLGAAGFRFGFFDIINNTEFFTSRPEAVIHATSLTAILSISLVGAVYFAGTEYILRKKLNLE
jgi:hypothetical protein